VACEIRLSGGAHASATGPSGASTGTHEATELRDGGERYGGRGVRQAVESVNGPITAELVGMDAAAQDALDAALRELDGTAGLSRLGANAVLAASLAAALAAVAQLGGLVSPGRRARGNGGRSVRAARETDLARHGRCSTRIERLPGDDAVDRRRAHPRSASSRRRHAVSSVAGGSVTSLVA